MGLEALTEKVEHMRGRQERIEERQTQLDSRMDKSEMDNAVLVAEVRGIKEQFGQLRSQFDKSTNKVFYAIIGFGVIQIIKPFFT